MTQEEKLEEAKKLYKTANADQKYVLESLFPELKESKDEKIRKHLIGVVELYYGKTEEQEKKDCLVWLEKQEGCEYIKKDWLEHIKQSWYKEGFIDGKYSGGTSKELTINDAATLKELIDFLENGTVKLQHDLTKYANWLKIQFTPIEKQGEQKPADKIEPKFKIGDWAVSDLDKMTRYISEVHNDKYNNYYVIKGDVETECNIDEYDRLHHLWTIQDAKDGDVLVNQNGEMPFIFKECKNNHIYCYCGYTNRKDIFFDRFVDSEDEELHWLNLYYEQAYPATKEQRDLLFQKMKEAGYEWDTEEKELKKIEDEEYNGEDYGLDSLFHAQRILEKILGSVDGYQSDDGILEHKCAISAVKKLYEQNIVWGEEDEACAYLILRELEQDKEDSPDYSKHFTRLIDWFTTRFKSLRPQSQWKPSESDIRILEQVIAGTANPINYHATLYAILEKLKKLREE